MESEAHSTAAVIIRSPPTGDLPYLCQFLGELGYPASTEAVARRLARFAGHTDRVVFVAEWNATPVGVATAHVIPALHVDELVAMLTAMDVAARHRGRGVGRSLVHSLEGWARRNGARRMSITSGLARNGAHAFYEHLGYEHTGRRYLKHLGSGEELER